MAVEDAFDDVVAHYDDWVRKAVPKCDEFFELAASLIPFDARSSIDILDLGAGTGLFSFHVWNKYKSAKYVLCDLAPKMLSAAKRRFQNLGGSFVFKVLDYQNLNCEVQYDAVISSLSIHHLDAPAKQRLFRTIFGCLRESGVFINLDQIKAPTIALTDLYWTTWLQHVRDAGGTEDQISASIERRIQYDKDSSLQDQLEWLKAAGFVDVDCISRHFFVGVFYARKPSTIP